MPQTHPWLDSFLATLSEGQLPEPFDESVGLPEAQLYRLWYSQVSSRLLDLKSRQLQARGQSFYTIGSAGHEGNAAVAAALRANDPAFLHYRSGAFFVERSQQVGGHTPLFDLLLSFAASEDDPISGGRHKVIGSKALHIPPQTSTIASHLPKAVGTAYAVGLSNRLQHEGTWPDDSIVLCSFGDASLNHSTAQGAINTAAWTAIQSVPMPILFVCEDNGIGISTATPQGWVQQRLQSQPHIRYFYANGSNVGEVLRISQAAADYVRRTRKPACLHLKTIRLFGHAGADSEIAYRTKEAIASDLAHDPVLFTSAALIEKGVFTYATLQQELQTLLARIDRVAEQAIRKPKLTTAEAVMAPLTAPLKGIEQPRNEVELREKSDNGPQTLAKNINSALAEILQQYPQAVLFGEDVAKKGGVYGVTQQLQQQFGKNRVINTLLDEQSIFGMAIGLAQQGFLPIPEIQFLAYVHNAEDQIRGEAATLSFFSNGQYHNGMLIRIAGLAYQKGFGGHFHNDNSFAVFRDIPGVILICPSQGEDAVLLLRQAAHLAYHEKRVVIFLEPIALYHARDLIKEDDQGWLHPYPAASTAIARVGEPAVYGDSDELAVISYGNGLYLSRQAQQRLKEQGMSIRVIDLRWLAPLHIEKVVTALGNCRQILIVDECRQRGSLSEELATQLHEHRPQQLNVQRLCAQDSFIPLGSAAYSVLPSVEDIIEKTTGMLRGRV